MVVSAGDPREDLENFMKIGEGSTGTVCIATYKSTGKIESNHAKAIKKPLLKCVLFEIRSSSGGEENGSTQAATP